MKAALAVVALLLVAAPPAAAAERWSRLRSGHFLIVGNTSERRMRLVAESLEQFHHVVSRALPPVAGEPRRPTVVYVFHAENSFKPYRPRFDGRPVDVVGFFQPAADVDYIAINAGFEPQALRIVFHEYAHALARNALGDMPLWASEGLAGVFETFEPRSGGRAGTIGIPRADHLSLLARGPLMRLTDLMAVDRASPIYHEGQRRGMFYAQSWALMHYLMLGSRARAVELATYMAQLQAGASAERALTVAFGQDMDALEGDLRDYLRLGRFSDKHLKADEPLDRVAALPAEPLADHEVTSILGELMSRVADADAARGPDPRVAIRRVSPDKVADDADRQPAAAESAVRRGDLADSSPSDAEVAQRFRPLGPGELRVLGVFSRIECTTGGVVLVVDAEDQTVRLGAPTLGHVSFNTYGAPRPTPVGCGALEPPARVLATYRDDQMPASVEGVDGAAVAVELLPDDDVPGCLECATTGASLER